MLTAMGRMIFCIKSFLFPALDFFETAASEIFYEDQVDSAVIRIRARRDLF